jgi:hypothetical protein
VETLTAVDRDILEGSFLNEGRKAVRIIDAQAAEIEKLRAALLTIKQAYDGATYTHGGDLRGLDELAIEAALARAGVQLGA